jgi:plasmid stabilization system protein ParE
MEDIVRRGRKRGIGCTLITQRPAVLNKNVLTQCEVLVALRLVHPKDIDAIEEWVNVHADPDTAKEMIDSLPSLAVGEAWFWSPGWGDLFQRVKVRHRETFDSGATPKAGEAPKRPKHLAEIDLAALGEQIKATVEKAKADDPKELRRQIAELKKQLASPAEPPRSRRKSGSKCRSSRTASSTGRRRSSPAGRRWPNRSPASCPS